MTTTRVQAIRSAVAGARPSGQPPGVIYTNWPDNQLGVVDAAGVAVDLLAIRNFSTTASYIVGNYVVRSGQLYQAIAPTGPGAFVPGSWSAVTSASVPSLPWFDTRALAAAAVIPAGPQALMTAGYTTAGDGGGELYYRVGGTTPGGFQSADGAWWALEGASRTRFWSDVNNGAAITTPRVLVQKERLFVGAATEYSNLARSGNPSFGWLAFATGANWAARDASILAVAEDGNVAIFGASRTSDGPSGTAAVGVGGYAVVDTAAPGGAWAGYFECARVGPATGGCGVEIDVKNCGGGVAGINPYIATGGPNCLWLACGPGSGAGGYGYTPNANSAAAMAIVCNTSGGNTFRFTSGIVVMGNSIVGTNGLDGELGNAVAISLARSHGIAWFATGGVQKVNVLSKLDSTDVDWQVYWYQNSMIFSRNGGTENALILTPAANAVNHFTLTNSIAGAAPQIQVQGTDTDVDVRLTPKGAGAVRFGTHAVKAAEAFSGYITVKDAAGNSRKLMVCA